MSILNDAIHCSVPPEKRARIIALEPVMTERYQKTRELLGRLADGADVPDYEIDLAREDLQTVLRVMGDNADEAEELAA